MAIIFPETYCDYARLGIECSVVWLLIYYFYLHAVCIF